MKLDRTYHNAMVWEDSCVNNIVSSCRLQVPAIAPCNYMGYTLSAGVDAAESRMVTRKLLHRPLVTYAAPCYKSVIRSKLDVTPGRVSFVSRLGFPLYA
jgi:hypothetical protein